jgi:hypothetical protein
MSPAPHSEMTSLPSRQRAVLTHALPKQARSSEHGRAMQGPLPCGNPPQAPGGHWRGRWPGSTTSARAAAGMASTATSIQELRGTSPSLHSASASESRFRTLATTASRGEGERWWGCRPAAPLHRVLWRQEAPEPGFDHDSRGGCLSYGVELGAFRRRRRSRATPAPRPNQVSELRVWPEPTTPHSQPSSFDGATSA